MNPQFNSGAPLAVAGTASHALHGFQEVVLRLIEGVLDRACGLQEGHGGGRPVLGVLAAVAEFERDLRAERCREGIAAAKAQGKPLGRKPALTAERADHARGLHRDGMSSRDVAKLLGVSKSAVGRLVFDGC